MNRLLLLIAILVTPVLLQADDRSVNVTDYPLETIAPGKAVVRDAKLYQHYEGLKHFARGRQLELQERIPEALQAYQMANQFDGQAIDLIRHMLPLCSKMQQTASTLRLIRRSLAIDAQQPDLWMRFAQELHDLERYPEALQTIETAFKSAKFDEYLAFAAELHVIRGSSLEAGKQYSEAVKSYQAAMAIVQDHNRFLEDPFSPTSEELPAEEARLLERLARACTKAQQYDAAFEAFKKAHVLHPQGNERFELNLAEVYLAASKPEAAIVHLEKAVEQKPTADEAYRLLVKAYEQAGRTEAIVPLLESLHLATPQHTAINLVLAEQLTQQKNYPPAERLYREIFTVEQAAFKDAIAGYYRLLMVQGKQHEVLIEFDQLLQQPNRGSWARAAIYTLLTEKELFKSVLAQLASVKIKPTTRQMLLKLCLQAELWPEAEALAREQLKSDPKPQELYLLLAKALLEQNKFAALAEVCQAAIEHPGVAQPLIFHIELAKAQARLHNSVACERALQSAKELSGPGTTDEHKVLCTVLYTQHILHQHEPCIKQATELLDTSLSRGPWARQVRYVLAHALEAVGKHEQALQQYDIMIKLDPNDSEALAAQARCLSFQNRDLKRAEATIRSAIELDMIEQRKRMRLGFQLAKLEPNPAYQATLGTILLRHGKAQEGIALLVELAQRQLKPDPWVTLAIGDGYLVQRQNDMARQCYRQALQLLPTSGTMGTDLSPSLQTRLKQLPAAILPVEATTSLPAKP